MQQYTSFEGNLEREREREISLPPVKANPFLFTFSTWLHAHAHAGRLGFLRPPGRHPILGRVHGRYVVARACIVFLDEASALSSAADCTEHDAAVSVRAMCAGRRETRLDERYAAAS